MKIVTIISLCAMALIMVGCAQEAEVGYINDSQNLVIQYKFYEASNLHELYEYELSTPDKAWLDDLKEVNGEYLLDGELFDGEIITFRHCSNWIRTWWADSIDENGDLYIREVDISSGNWSGGSTMAERSGYRSLESWRTQQARRQLTLEAIIETAMPAVLEQCHGLYTTHSELAQLYEPIRTREQAISYAETILDGLNSVGHTVGFRVGIVEHDATQNIWVFSYRFANDYTLGLLPSYAICGATGKVIARWVS